jgi:general secretion pathway protein M
VNELLERARNAWDNLSPREQILVGAAGAALAVTLLVFAIVMPVLGMADRESTRVQSAEQQIMAMIRLQREYAEISGRLQGVEQRIKNQGNQQNIRTLLDNLAQNSSVRIASMEERQASKNDQYVETKVEVSLRNVSLSQTIKYLHNIEASPQQLSVKSLRIKGRGDQSQLLDVTFAVSSFEPS